MKNIVRNAGERRPLFILEASEDEVGVPHVTTALELVKVEDLHPQIQAEVRRSWARLVAIGKAQESLYGSQSGIKPTVASLEERNLWGFGVVTVDLFPGRDGENPDEYIAHIGRTRDERSLEEAQGVADEGPRIVTGKAHLVGDGNMIIDLLEDCIVRGEVKPEDIPPGLRDALLARKQEKENDGTDR